MPCESNGITRWHEFFFLIKEEFCCSEWGKIFEIRQTCTCMMYTHMYSDNVRHLRWCAMYLLTNARLYVRLEPWSCSASFVGCLKFLSWPDGRGRTTRPRRLCDERLPDRCPRWKQDTAAATPAKWAVAVPAVMVAAMGPHRPAAPHPSSRKPSKFRKRVLLLYKPLVAAV